MFASKHQAGAPRELAEAADRAFAPALAAVADGQTTGAVVAGAPERVAKVAFAAIHGLVALASNGMLDDDLPLEAFLDEAVERLVAGLRPRG
jgi:hypothetical protein